MLNEEEKPKFVSPGIFFKEKHENYLPQNNEDTEGIGEVKLGGELKSELTLANPSAFLEGSITLNVGNGLEIIRLCANGDIYVKGNLVENDKEVVQGFREFIAGWGNR